MKKAMDKIRNDRNVVFRRIRVKKKASDLASNDFIKDKNGKIAFSEDGRKRVWKEHMEFIMNEKNPWMGWWRYKWLELPWSHLLWTKWREH